VIGPDNAAQLQQVDQSSQSGTQLFTWLPGETALALATGTEIHLYSLDPLAETSAIEVTATTRLAASPGGGQLAAARQDYSILLWDVAGQSEVATLKGHTQEVTGIDYAPDGQLLASSSADNTLKLWDSSDGSLIQTWDLPFWPSSVEFSPDGSQLALIDPQEFSAHIFDVPEGEEQRTLAWTEHASPVLYSASFSPDWTALAWVARGTIQLMDAETGELGHTLSHEEFISDMAWSPDGSLVAAAAAATVEGEFHPAVVLWDVQAGQQVNVLVQSQVAFDVSFSPDGTHLAILSSDGVLSLWAVAD
jgi:WD40 repeat protein